MLRRDLSEPSAGSALPAKGCGESWTRCGRGRHARAWSRSVEQAKVKSFGRHKGGSIRDGVILSLDGRCARRSDVLWSCDSDDVIAAFHA